MEFEELMRCGRKREGQNSYVIMWHALQLATTLIFKWLLNASIFFVASELCHATKCIFVLFMITIKVSCIGMCVYFVHTLMAHLQVRSEGSAFVVTVAEKSTA